MNIFYTYTYGKNGQHIEVQDRIAKAANKLGYREIPIYCDTQTRDSIEQCDLDVQMDGSFSSFSNCAVLIVQYPSGAGFRFDKAIIEHARMYLGATVIIYNHPHVLKPENEGGVSAEVEQELFENADLVVEPYQLNGFDEMLLTQKEIIDAILAATYRE